MDTKRLRQRVLDLAIHGKLVPQNPQDEPASELLKRIAEEKERLIKDGKIKKSKKKANEDIDEVPFEVPQGWVWCRLDDLASYKKGPFGSSLTKAMFVPDSDTAYKVYEQKNAIQKDHTLGSYYIDAEKYEELKGFTVLPQDIIVSCAGTIGETYVLPNKIRKGIINQALMIIRLYLPQIQNYYLYYFNFFLKKNAATEGNGTAIKNIPPFEVLKNYLFPLPPLAELHRIVSEVEKYFSLIDILEESENDLQQSIQKAKSKILDLAIKGKLVEQNEEDEPASILLERIKKEDNKNEKKSKIKDTGKIYEVPFEVPQGWVWCRLGDIATLINGDRGKNYPNKNEYVSQGIPWINAGHITTSGFLSNTQMNYITEEKYNMLGSGKIRENDLVFCLRGSYGKVAKVEPYNKGAIASSLVIIRVYNEIIRNYIFHLLRSNYAKLQLSLYDNGTAQPNIAAKDVEKYCIPLPPLAEQHRIVAKIEELFTQLDNIAEALK